MLETYAFFVMFVVQVLTMSVLYPAWFIRYARAQAASLPAERFARVAQLYPGVDVRLAMERYLTRYRVLNAGIAVLGLLFLGWLFSYMRRPDWDDGDVITQNAVYFVVQLLPLCMHAWWAVRGKAQILDHSSPERRRTATLQRRSLFDFVSPFIVFLTGSLYLGFAVFVVYVQQGSFEGLDGYIALGAVTLTYTWNGFGAYMLLYGRKINAIETGADSAHTIGMGVKACVYSCMAVLVYLWLNFGLELLDLDRWMPFAQSAFFVVSSLLCLMSLMAPPRQSAVAGLGSSRRMGTP